MTDTSIDHETLRLAFWLRDYIFREGLAGVHFMRAAERWAEDNAADTVAKEISKETGKL